MKRGGYIERLLQFFFKSIKLSVHLFGLYYYIQALKCKEIRTEVFPQSLAILVHQKFV